MSPRRHSAARCPAPPHCRRQPIMPSDSAFAEMGHKCPIPRNETGPVIKIGERDAVLEGKVGHRDSNATAAAAPSSSVSGGDAATHPRLGRLVANKGEQISHVSMPPKADRCVGGRVGWRLRELGYRLVPCKRPDLLDDVVRRRETTTGSRGTCRASTTLRAGPWGSPNRGRIACSSSGLLMGDDRGKWSSPFRPFNLHLRRQIPVPAECLS